MYEGFTGFMEFAMIFFNWWTLIMGIVIGLAGGVLGALLGLPVIYQVNRRRALRKQWRLDRPRQMKTYLAPQWGEYSQDTENIDRRCVCHNRVLGEGETVLLWPEMGPFGILYTAVYCENVRDRV
jgi:hypothetical protein